MKTKPSRKAKSRLSGYPASWLPIYNRKYPSGQQGYSVDYGLVNGKRKLRSTLDLSEAEALAEQGGISKKNEGMAAFSLSPDERAEATACIKRLQPHGVSLRHAVDHYVKTVLAYHDAPTIKVIVERMVAAATSNKRRDRTVQELRSRLGLFAARFPDRKLASITLEELEAYIDDPAYSARTRINIKTKICQVYNYAKRKQWVSENLTERLETISAEPSEIYFFSPDQCASILSHADDYGLLPYVAIGMFAGLRNNELNRLDWSAVNLAERAIRVGARVAKKRSQGVVTINETLAAWLAPYIKPKGKIVELDYWKCQKQWGELRIKAGIIINYKNGLRHSFGTYHFSAYKNLQQTAFEMREKDPVIVLNHYRGHTNEADARRFWSLRPGSAENVVAMKAG